MRFVKGQRTYIVAEIGANHNGDMELARKMVRSAKDLGCDSVKFQSWDTTLFSESVYQHDSEQRKADGDSGSNLREMVERYAVPQDKMAALRAFCADIGIDFASTPFSPREVQDLVDLDAPFIKIASMDLTNDHLLRIAAQTGKPIVLSTGLSTLSEIDHAVATIEAEGNRDIVILHCVSLYPPRDEQVNLNNMDMLGETFGYPVGFSDHTIGTEISLAAISKGAVLLEKHFTLEKTMEGWDHAVSAEPQEMAVIVSAASRIHTALGSKRRTVSAQEAEQRKAFRRSIVAARSITAGDVIAGEDLTYKRPGTGIEPNLAPLLQGMVAARDIAKDELIALRDLRPAAH